MRLWRMIFYKEVHQLLTNGAIYWITLVPYATFLMIFMIDNRPDLPFIIALALVLMPMQIMASLLVEEKELHAWRVFDQSGVSFLLLLAGKAMISLFITVVFITLAIWVSEVAIIHAIGIVVFTVPIAVFFASVGAVAAAFSNNRLEVGFWEGPVFLLFISQAIIYQNLSEPGILPMAHFDKAIANIIANPFSVVGEFLVLCLFAFICVPVALHLLNRKKHSF
ncbi:ABC transporter, permease [Geomicrobium sp. JCM 19037]|uniref:hypothetical protein n=1 Tax=Geomicrobium sp. JCM 19037 TaxID=1460634 RepID=UPI00045F4659|nr:hypothetical protein [Geomicrobium sp. JCM 19037]GAK02276.1 ABC transporter, permease [Geomicrobium sp. JCM 19037]